MLCTSVLSLTHGAHAHEGYSTHFVCVRLEFAAFNSRLYIKYDITFRPFFFVLNFVDFDKKPSLSRKSVFHGYFVVYSR